MFFYKKVAHGHTQFWGRKLKKKYGKGENIKKRGTKYTPDIFREEEYIIDNGTLYTPEVFRCVYFSSSPIL
jgi:hypothetical protein